MDREVNNFLYSENKNISSEYIDDKFSRSLTSTNFQEDNDFDETDLFTFLSLISTPYSTKFFVNQENNHSNQPFNPFPPFSKEAHTLLLAYFHGRRLNKNVPCFWLPVRNVGNEFFFFFFSKIFCYY
jgi:hypothetical protein